MKTILIISTHYLPVPPFEGYGATERGVYDIAMWLATNGYSVKLIAPESSSINHPNVELIGFSGRGTRESSLQGSHTHSVREVMATAESRSESFRIFIEQYITHNQKDIDCVNLRWIDHSLVGLMREKFPHLPLIVTSSNITDEIKRIAAEFQDIYITAHTQAHKKAIGSSDNIYVVRYGIDSERAIFSSTDLVSSDPGSDLLPIQRRLYEMGRGYILYVGRLSKLKSPATAIDILNGYAGSLIIAGEVIATTERALEKAQEYVETRIKPSIDGITSVLYGSADEEEKFKLMTYASCLIVPTGFEAKFSETFGRVVAEANLCGTPALVYERSGGAAEQIQEGVNGFLFSSVKDAISKLVRINSINRSACREHAMRNVSLEVYGEEFNRLVKNIL